MSSSKDARVITDGTVQRSYQPHRHNRLNRHHHNQLLRRQRSSEEARESMCKNGSWEMGQADRVRAAWCSSSGGEDDNETMPCGVIARRIGTGSGRTLTNPRKLEERCRTRVSLENAGSLLYSRRELAERLRLAWKDREANRSNIDVFLARGTIEESADSRLSSSSSLEQSPERLVNETRRVAEMDADSKRASFRSRANPAFTRLVNDPVDEATPIGGHKNRRANSAPPAKTRPEASRVINRVPRDSKYAKRRSKSAKRRADSLQAVKHPEAAKNHKEVITMVSLVSDADTDAETDSPADDKLIDELRNNLPIAPAVGNSSALVARRADRANGSRPIKTVSFRQDSLEEDAERRRFLGTLGVEGRVQVGRVNGSALPTPEEANAWKTVSRPSVPSIGNKLGDVSPSPYAPMIEISLTDREKRCLVVPIGDSRSDRKRKLLRTKTAPPRRNNDLEVPAPPQDPPIISSVTIDRIAPHRPPSIFSEPSFPKPVIVTTIEENEGETRAPAFSTPKEKECWHLYRRMCDKGVCVSFDTVLRGMLTPTEYRLRKSEI